MPANLITDISHARYRRFFWRRSPRWASKIARFVTGLRDFLVLSATEASLKQGEAWQKDYFPLKQLPIICEYQQTVLLVKLDITCRAILLPWMGGHYQVCLFRIILRAFLKGKLGKSWSMFNAFLLPTPVVGRPLNGGKEAHRSKQLGSWREAWKLVHSFSISDR